MHVGRFGVVLANAARKHKLPAVFATHSRGLAHPELFAITSEKQDHLVLQTSATRARYPVGIRLAGRAHAGWYQERIHGRSFLAIF